MNKRDLIKHFQPFADKLAAELTELASEHIDGLLEQARSYAIEMLRAQLEGKTDAEEDTGHSDRAGSRTEVSKRKLGRKHKGARGGADRTVRARAEKSAQRPTCSKCGETGHNARTCGREQAKPSAPALAVVPKPPPQSRTAAIASLQSKRQRSRGELLNEPPPGWTVEDDRREEFLDLSMHTALRKA